MKTLVKTIVVLFIILAISFGHSCVITYFNNEQAVKETLEKLERLQAEKTTLVIERDALLKDLAELKRQNELSSRGGYIRGEHNPHEPSRLSAEQIEKVLVNTQLVGLGETFKKQEEQYGTNTIFAVAVAGFESGWGRYHTGGNLFGITTGKGNYRQFTSENESVMCFGELIASGYSDLLSVETIAKRYCPPNSANWARNIRQIMGEVWRKTQ